MIPVDPGLLTVPPLPEFSSCERARTEVLTNANIDALCPSSAATLSTRRVSGEMRLSDTRLSENVAEEAGDCGAAFNGRCALTLNGAVI